MIKRLSAFLAITALSLCSALAQQKSVTIAVVNNPDMIRLQKLSHKFEEQNPDIKLNWVVLEENTLRQRVTVDVSQGAGAFDLVYLGLYEAPIFAKRGWVKPMENIDASYDLEDVFQALRDGLSYKGKLYALPFNAESCMTIYRKDLFEAKGLTMPDQPTWDDIKKFSDVLGDKGSGVYGITLRGKPGWGENMGLITCIVNSFGGSWFDMSWKPQLTSPEWKKAITFYVDLLKKNGPPGASSNGFNENLTLFSAGKAAMWIDATSACGPLYDRTQSKVADKTAFTQAPIAATPTGSHWLWSWALAIPNAAKPPEAALKFAEWATSKEYTTLAAADGGWATVPPGTRKSLYENKEYLDAAPFASVTLTAMQSADPKKPSVKPVPYTGVQFVGIPEFQSFGALVGQNISSALAGSESVESALKTSQQQTEKAVKQGGYLK